MAGIVHEWCFNISGSTGYCFNRVSFMRPEGLANENTFLNLYIYKAYFSCYYFNVLIINIFIRGIL